MSTNILGMFVLHEWYKGFTSHVGIYRLLNASCVIATHDHKLGQATNIKFDDGEYNTCTQTQNWTTNPLLEGISKLHGNAIEHPMVDQQMFVSKLDIQ
jgi:hypothetical protein